MEPHEESVLNILTRAKNKHFANPNDLEALKSLKFILGNAWYFVEASKYPEDEEFYKSFREWFNTFKKELRTLNEPA